jgi:DNA-directed RNA polymerase subunit RPC12/RpoP
MERSRKKLLVFVAVVCLAAAGAIAIMNVGARSQFKGQPTLYLKCEACGHTFQMDRSQLAELQRRRPGEGMKPPVILIECPNCGERAGRPAMKCAECGHIFFPQGDANHPPMVCPECSHDHAAGAPD